MIHPLIDALSETRGWPRIDDEGALENFIAGPGDRVLFIPGDPAKTPEALDVAVILPELHAAFGGRFECAVIGPAIDRAVRDRFDVWPTPSLIFLREGTMCGAIPKVRDWSDYLARIAGILGLADASRRA